MVAPGLTCAADKETRTITVTFPSGFFDERRAYAMFGEAMSVLLGRKYSVPELKVERWIDLEAMPDGV